MLSSVLVFLDLFLCVGISPARVSDCGRFLILSPLEWGQHQHVFVALLPWLWGHPINSILDLLTIVSCSLGRQCGVGCGFHFLLVMSVVFSVLLEWSSNFYIAIISSVSFYWIFIKYCTVHKYWYAVLCTFTTVIMIH